MSDIRDKLATGLADSLNKKFDNKVAHFLDGVEETPTDISDWVNTGSTLLNLAISNKPNGGLPVGRIVEVNGLESSGKSLLAATAIAETQKRGGVGVLISTETAEFPQFLEAVDVDLDNLLYVQLECIEDIFETAETIIEKVRSQEKNRLVTIVIDSIAGATTKKELEGDFGDTGYNTSKAIIIGQSLRKITNMIAREKILLICTNQLREKMGVIFGDKWTTSGGKALAFHSSVRIRLKMLGQITQIVNKKKRVIGVKTHAKIIKNRVGPPFRDGEFDIYFSGGIDDSRMWLEELTRLKVIQKKGQSYIINENENGKTSNKLDERPKFKTTEFLDYMDSNPKFYEFAYNKLCEDLILQYRQDRTNPDDVEIEE